MKFSEEISKKVNFIEGVFGNFDVGSKNNIQVKCPNCLQESNKIGVPLKKKKLAIAIDKNFIVKCWVCGFNGSLLWCIKKFFSKSIVSEYIKIFGVSDNGNKFLKDKDNDAEIEHPDDFRFLVNDRSKYGNLAKNYCFKRGLVERDFWFFRLGVAHGTDWQWKNRVIMPLFDESGEYICFCGRDIGENNKYKYYNTLINKNNVIFNEFHISWDEELTIVEGIFDLVKANDNATCLLGSDLSKNSKLLKKIVEHETPVLLALDKDMNSSKTLKMADMLVKNGVKTRILFEFGGFNDLGEMSKKDFLKLSKQAKIWSYDSKIKNKINNLNSIINL